MVGELVLVPFETPRPDVIQIIGQVHIWERLLNGLNLGD